MMMHHMKTTGLLFLCGMFALSGLAGCVSHTQKVPMSSAHPSAADDSFAAGAGRPPTAETSYTFARILVAQGRDRDAIFVLNETIRQHPDFLPAYNEIADVYVRADRIDDAVACLTAALKRAPDDGILLNNLGMCRLLQKKYEQALESFARATKAAPSNPIFRANHATALAFVGRDAEAVSEYQTVVERWQAKENLAIIAKTRPAPAGTGSEKPATIRSMDDDASPVHAAPSTAESSSQSDHPTTAPAVLRSST